MVSKKEALTLLSKGADYEEKIILGWKDAFIQDVLSDKALSRAKKDQMVQIIKVVGIQSLQHYRTMIDWQLKVSRSDSDEY